MTDCIESSICVSVIWNTKLNFSGLVPAEPDRSWNRRLHKIEVHKEIERIDFHFFKTCSIFILFIIGSSLGAKAEKYTFDVTPLLYNF